MDNQPQARVSDRQQRNGPDLPSRFKASAINQPSSQRQNLDGMNADEVGNTQISGDIAPGQ